MAIYTFRKGDRVKSKVAGFYMGIPGTIIGTSQIQYNLDKRYIIELDIGKKNSISCKPFRTVKEIEEAEAYKSLLNGLNLK